MIEPIYLEPEVSSVFDIIVFWRDYQVQLYRPVNVPRHFGCAISLT